MPVLLCRDAEDPLQVRRKLVHLFPDFVGLLQERFYSLRNGVGAQFDQLGRCDDKRKVAIDIMSESGKPLIQCFHLLDVQVESLGR